MQNSKDFKLIGRHKITHVFCFINFSISPCKNMTDSYPIWKKVENVKFKCSPQKKNLNKHNQVFLKKFKSGLFSLSLQLKKGKYGFI